MSDAQIITITVCAEFKVRWQALKLCHEGWLQLEVHLCVGPVTVFCHTMEGKLEAYIIEMADDRFSFDWKGVRALTVSQFG